MAGGRKAAEKLLAKDPEHFAKLGHKHKGQVRPKNGLASIDTQKRRWIALRGVVSRGHNLRPEAEKELAELNTIFASGVRSSLRRNPKVYNAVSQILDD